ncbi:MAG: NAD-dependent epimerase/dehydratase family protein [Calditrichaeota bacterium]|nr:NAD-dependent epimerase/dehydratase family protein [Calditrichota bacterium]
MKILFIGGTGVISSACSDLCVHKGYELWLITRSNSFRPVPHGAKLLKADIRKAQEVNSVLGDHKFDVIVDFISFETLHLQNNLKLFKDRFKQYVFISTASAYHKPVLNLPITESTPLKNPFWEYSRKKIACEEYLMAEYVTNGLPVTIVRPSHTYDKTMVPLPLGRFTSLYRLMNQQKIIIHGDGTSLWTLTHHHDFAVGMVGLLGNYKALGESFHITSGEILNWNEIVATYGYLLGIEPKIVHIPSDFIALHDTEWGDGLLGDKAHSKFFDNSKIKQFVPEFRPEIRWYQGAGEILEWYQAHPEHAKPDDKANQRIENIITAYLK